MKDLANFSRIPLGVLPTPLYKLENLSRELVQVLPTAKGRIPRRI